MFAFDIPLSTADFAALGGLFFLMITARFLHEESRLAAYGLIAAVLTDNPAVLYCVPLLAYTIKMMRF